METSNAPVCPICGRSKGLLLGNVRTISAALNGWGIEGEIIQRRTHFEDAETMASELEKTRAWWDKYRSATTTERSTWDDDAAKKLEPFLMVACGLKDCMEKLDREMRKPFCHSDLFGRRSGAVHPADPIEEKKSC